MAVRSEIMERLTNDFCSYGERKDGDAADGLASVAETRFDYCPWCGARMDGDDDAKES